MWQMFINLRAVILAIGNFESDMVPDKEPETSPTIQMLSVNLYRWTGKLTGLFNQGIDHFKVT